MKEENKADNGLGDGENLKIWEKSEEKMLNLLARILAHYVLRDLNEEMKEFNERGDAE